MRTQPDPERVPTADELDVDDFSSIAACAAAFGVSQSKLVEAVRVVGCDMRDLRVHLARFSRDNRDS